MKLLFPILTVGLMILANISLSQDLGCGTEVTQEVIEWERNQDQEKYKRSLQRYMSHAKRTFREFRIQIHIVTQNDGAGGIDSAVVIREIQDFVNPYFEGMNVSFIACAPINYIPSTAYYQLSSFGEGDALSKSHNIDSLINIYYVGNANGVCGWTRLPSQLPEDYIVIDSSCANNTSTLTHELGHYFALYHTHEDHFGKEKITRDVGNPCYNCYSHGDLICDTQADPGLYGEVNYWCQYTGNQKDACGQTYVPDPENIMSYSFSHCRDLFTPEQEARMLVAMATSRSYLITSPCECPPPKALCKSVSLGLDDNGIVSITPEEVNDGSEWYCGLYSWSVSPNTFDCSDIGINTITLTVTDSSGNTATCQSTAYINDSMPPMVQCLNNQVYLDREGKVIITGGLVNNSSHDPCGIADLTVEPDHFDCTDLGTQLVTLTAQDHTGNKDQCTASVTVKDNRNPDFSCNAITIWPNPVRNMLNILVSRSGYYGNVQVELYDLLGRSNQKEKVVMDERITQQLDLSYLPNGQYILRIYLDSSGEVVLRKFIVNR